MRQADGLPHGRARRPVRWVQKKKGPSGPPPTLGCLGPLCVAETAARDPLPPRIPSWVIRLTDSGGLETNLEFAPRPPRAIGSESKGFWGPQKRAGGLRGGACSASLEPLEGGGRLGWAVDAFLNAEKSIAARKCHLGILSEYGPFSVNTPIWRLQNLRLVSEYDAPRSPYIILISEMHTPKA